MKKLNQNTVAKRKIVNERPIDITEDRKDYTISISVPDFTQDDVKMNVKDDLLRIAIHEERLIGQNSKKVYERSFKLPTNVNAHLITANLSDSVLYVKIPKNTLRSNRII
ncbi:MAG: Hsp20/alpha crystallin family protein [Bacteroidota bacterium]|nr:Hsp20/alpha crystallin family protein [Bacteroidota bacterium]